MRSSRWIAESHFLLACRAGLARRRVGQSGKEPAGTKIHRAMLLVLVTAALAAMPVPARSQSLLSSGDPSATSGITAPVKLDLTYVRPTERTKVSNYAFDAFGPYPIAGAGFAAGINQWTNSPPEWGQGARGLRQAVWVRLWDRGYWNHHALWAGGSLQGRYVVLPLRMQRPISAAASCSDLHVDRAPRRRRPSRLLFLRACRALCGFHDCGSPVVSGSLRRKGCVPDGQLQPAELYGRQHCSGVLL